MADALTEIDLDTLQTAIENDIKAAFPVLATVEFYPETRSGMPLPACELEISEWQDFEDPDPGTEQLAVMMRFEARFIIKGIAEKQSKRDIRKLAAAFSAWLRLRRWSDAARPGKCLPTGPAQFLQAMPDDFHPDLDQFEVWHVEWEQIVHLGESVWKPGDAPPSIVFAGFVPDIGTGHQDDYLQVLP